MTFLDLYSTQLTRRLGSSQTTLFTSSERMAAVNEAQEWFNTQTNCLTRTASITLVDEQQEYDLEDEIDDEDFIKLAPQGVEISITPDGGTTRYLAGDLLVRKPIAWLNRYRSGWREEAAGEPDMYYEREDAGRVFLGFVCPPGIPAVADDWLALVPYVITPTAMVDDADEPFTVDSDPLKALRPWHDALADYAASQLELRRKDIERSEYFRMKAERRVQDWLDKQRPPGGQSLSVRQSYRRDASSRGIEYLSGGPRRW